MVNGMESRAERFAAVDRQAFQRIVASSNFLDALYTFRICPWYDPRLQECHFREL
jgi:hypothetical protein